MENIIREERKTQKKAFNLIIFIDFTVVPLVNTSSVIKYLRKQV
ncbi:hypothetical protein Q8G35_24945 [Peribacillus simplex]|uniref:Uncharacterized protein n=2 Tax=Peribacillus TaxID=2675229 RepID=A0AA90PGX3_9BACI|nr:MULTISPECIES: hypothetical protein [Peribacillus]MDP1421529.1 hypothetical protein [Peribacillus simplex]MDP1454266.1 hypothetical protein [Peribacillus frigoritolerans]